MTGLHTKRMRREEPPVNPMDGLSNLADAMLVLAVGIMLALIINWKVELGTAAELPETTEEPIAMTEEDLQDADPESVDTELLEQVGALYYDEKTGIFYAITGE